MKCVVFAGSHRPENSVSFEATKRILAGLGEYINEDLETDVFNLNNTNIKLCLGCSSCFKTGKCPLNDTDDITNIKEKMLEADLIIIATPIYAGNVSGFTNMFFQRLAGWFHIMPLIGKKVILVTSSSGNGIYHTTNFMRNIVWGLGLKIISVLNVIANNKEELDTPYNADIINKCTQLAYKCISENIAPEIFNKGLDEYFHAVKEAVKESDINKNKYEYDYWNNTGLLACDNYAEAERLLSEKVNTCVLGG